MEPATSLLVFALVFAACGGLPSNFENLPLEETVKAYEQHFRWGGSSLVEGRAYISWHGQEAATLMIPFLQARRQGIPPREALIIIWDVQLRGCDLRGTAAEHALRQLREDRELPWDFRKAVEAVLDSITDGSHSKPGQLDGLTGGPCEKAFAARQALADGESESN